MAECVRASAPGKVILFGEHAVVHGSRAVAVALDAMRIVASVARRSDRTVRIDLPDVGLSFEVSTADLGLTRERGDALPAPPTAVVNRTLALLPEDGALYLGAPVYLASELADVEGCTITVMADGLPIGAGLGSSAALAVAVSAALLESASQGAAADLEVVNAWAYAAEVVSCGTPSGLDNAVSCFGGGVIAKKDEKGALQRESLALPTLGLLITNTLVPKSTKQLVAKVRAALELRPLAIRPLFEAVDAVVGEFASICRSDESSQSSKRISELVVLNHNLLRCLEVSHPALEDVADTARKFNAPSKLTGAGGGGCAITLLHDAETGLPLDVRSVAELEKTLRRKGYECYRTTTGGSGVAVDTEGGPLKPPADIPRSLKARALLVLAAALLAHKMSSMVSSMV